MLTPEQRARQLIDARLAAAGWAVQEAKLVNLGAGPGVAVREYPTASGRLRPVRRLQAVGHHRGEEGRDAPHALGLYSCLGGACT